MTPVKISRHVVVFDAADIDTESAFWARLLGGAVEAGPNWHAVLVDGVEQVGIQFAPNHVPPQWPSGRPQQVHLDLFVDDIATAHAEVIAMGATVLRTAPSLDIPRGFQVYADPAGHPFCLCWDR
jgi:predicted enzyme related to lactoylglutathione lyase